MKNYLIAALITLSLGGCASLAGNKHEIVTYVLKDPGHVISPAVPNPHTLLVVGTTTNAFYNTDSIAFSRAPDTRGLYQYAHWTEHPGKRVGELLLARLAADHIFATVASSGSNVKGGWLLDTRLLEFYHRATSSPGSSYIELRAEVLDLQSRTLVGRKLFIQEVPAPAYNAAGAVTAFNIATGKLLDDIEAWLQSLPASGTDAVANKLP